MLLNLLQYLLPVCGERNKNVTADVKISSFTCGWASKKDKYGYVRDFFQAKGYDELFDSDNTFC